MHVVISLLSRLFAIIGGVALGVLIVLTCLSVVGRALNTVLHGDVVQAVIPGMADRLLATGIGPIDGDFELVQVGMAFAIFAFLPLCQLNGSHASVDIFTSRLPLRANRVLRLMIELLFTAVLVLIAVQLFAGMESKRGSGQTTLLLQYPVWWGYAACVPGAIVAASVSVYITIARVLEVATGQEVLPPELEADH